MTTSLSHGDMDTDNGSDESSYSSSPRTRPISRSTSSSISIPESNASLVSSSSSSASSNGHEDEERSRNVQRGERQSRDMNMSIRDNSSDEITRAGIATAKEEDVGLESDLNTSTLQLISLHAILAVRLERARITFKEGLSAAAECRDDLAWAFERVGDVRRGCFAMDQNGSLIRGGVGDDEDGRMSRGRRGFAAVYEVVEGRVPLVVESES